MKVLRTFLREVVGLKQAAWKKNVERIVKVLPSAQEVKGKGNILKCAEHIFTSNFDNVGMTQ